MGLEAGNGKGGGGVRKRLHSLMRRKHVDSDRVRAEEGGGRTLAKELSVPDLVAIGVGSTIGAGVYVLVGAVAREQSGPALTLSFLIAGIAAALSALCYAELASRCPSAGSAYHYSYVCIGEGVAWLIGWSLILEYTISGAAVARGLTPNLALFFGGQENLPAIFARAHIPGLNIIVDPCAALLVLIITGLLCWGIKESSSVQAIVTTANVCVMSFVIVAVGYIGFKTGWVGYKASGGYFPYGLSGMLTGSASVFFAYIGFDSVASTAEEVKNPRRDLPLGIGAAFSICCLLYMLVSVVIVGMVPYYAMDPDTPISSAFAMNDLRWAMYIVAAGTVLALCSTLLGSLLPQPRILMAMARDGLLPTLFSDVNEHTQVPVKGTILTGVFAATLAFFMDVSQLAGMVSVGTLLAFTIVAISILILRYVPPDEVCLPSSFHESIKSRSSHGYVQLDNGKEVGNNGKNQSQQGGTSLLNDEASLHFPLIVKETKEDKNEQSRRMKASCSITSVCIGILVITTLASYTFLPVYVRYSMCSLGGLLILGGLSVLSWIDQDDGRHTFGCPGGFLCPFVPLLPACSIFINAYLLVNLGGDTWMRVLVWLLIGILVYIFYGRTHSSLSEVVYLPTAHTNEIHRNSSRSSA